jgi:hypothetical protein
MFGEELSEEGSGLVVKLGLCLSGRRYWEMAGCDERRRTTTQRGSKSEDCCSQPCRELVTRDDIVRPPHCMKWRT